MHLYEAHLAVRETEAARDFYTRIVGLEFAHRDGARDIVFLWAGPDRRSMLGLWGPETVRGRDFHTSHIAFAMSLPELLAQTKRLSGLGVVCRNFMEEETTEPSVIGWMPSAQIYFKDPDGHSLEFISLLDDAPAQEFVGSLSAWRKLRRDNGTSSTNYVEGTAQKS